MPMTPAELEAYRRRFEAARSFEDDDEWFKMPAYTTSNNTPMVTANKPVLKPTAQKWSFQGIQPPTAPKLQKFATEANGALKAARSSGAVQHPVQYPRAFQDYQKSNSAGDEHGRVDSRASCETDEQSPDESVGEKTR